MKEALYYKKLADEKVNCTLCPKNCIIAEGKYGFCNARKNIEGKLYSAVYGNPSSMCIDPIEKKPLYHFLPGSTSLSIGTFGCNLSCKHCQNWTIARAKPPESFEEATPEVLVEQAVDQGCASISYTYNEPAIFFEYVLDTAKLARKKGLRNVIVTNGFINEKPLKEWATVIDAANVDLKAFNEKFYSEICLAKLQPVLKTLKIISKTKMWFEITNLIIPTKNDDFNEIKKMCGWIKANIGTEKPLHFTAFYPCYKMMGVPPTSPETLKKARKIALGIGIKYVYTGNVTADEGSHTYCPKCKQPVIQRSYFSIISNEIKNSKCPCGEKVAGVWE
jgi:pyruvate formate lyase activating enzyme